MPQIDETLKELDRWYSELPGGTDRPKMLSKLATLELCGWLEERFDALVHAAGTKVGLDTAWIDDQVIASNYGFSYAEHLRRMLSRLVGESGVQFVETTFELDHPGKLDQLKSLLGSLWKSRGVLAHTHSAAPITTQQVVYAPSWSLNQHRIMAKAIDQFEASLNKAFQRSIAAP